MSIPNVRDIINSQVLKAKNDPETVTGSGASTDEAHPRFDGTDGKKLQDSQLIENDNGRIGLNIAPQANEKMTIQGDTSDNQASVLKLVNSSGDVIMRVVNNGRVGFGTTAPSAQLTSRLDGAGIQVPFTLENFQTASAGVGIQWQWRGIGAIRFLRWTAFWAGGNTDNANFKLAIRGLGSDNTVWTIIGDKGNMAFGPNDPDRYASLDLQTTNAAFLTNRLTTSQRDNLTPKNGMIIYNTTLNKFQGFENGSWANLI